ncbi:hypothetical protein G6714_06560 [Polynucleobacter paneuropaeus]|nr:hypothetical protein [Polynucleobacter paneuropaeus]
MISSGQHKHQYDSWDGDDRLLLIMHWCCLGH